MIQAGEAGRCGPRRTFEFAAAGRIPGCNEVRPLRGRKIRNIHLFRDRRCVFLLFTPDVTYDLYQIAELKYTYLRSLCICCCYYYIYLL